MDRVVYYFDNGEKRVEEVTESGWLEEISSIKGFKGLESAEDGVLAFNTTLININNPMRVAYFRVIK